MCYKYLKQTEKHGFVKILMQTTVFLEKFCILNSCISPIKLFQTDKAMYFISDNCLFLLHHHQNHGKQGQNFVRIVPLNRITERRSY